MSDVSLTDRGHPSPKRIAIPSSTICIACADASRLGPDLPPLFACLWCCCRPSQAAQPGPELRHRHQTCCWHLLHPHSSLWASLITHDKACTSWQTPLRSAEWVQVLLHPEPCLMGSIVDVDVMSTSRWSVWGKVVSRCSTPVTAPYSEVLPAAPSGKAADMLPPSTMIEVATLRDWHGA